jgi:plastocyanin
VSVGKNGLTFEPNEIRAQQGDVIEFRFWPRNHSVVAGDFNNPCRPAEDNGFFSGFFPTQQGVNVRNAQPPHSQNSLETRPLT